MHSRFTRTALVAVFVAVAATPLTAKPHHLMRYADVHTDRIVFTYEDDLWIVSSQGGQARRLTNDSGTEAWARFSPDGKWLAFSAEYDGGYDVYVMPAEGGVPTRLTYYPGGNRVLGWWPDGSSVLFRASREWPARGEEVYRVAVELSADGGQAKPRGMPERLPVDRAGLTAVSPDGKQIAYNRISREARTWKRHRGGTAQDIWMGSLEKMDYRKIIDTDWSDNFPMWQGDAIYFLSDREDGTVNIYKYDVKSGNVTRLTQYKDYDIKYPSIGPNQIVYQYQESLHLLDLNSGQAREVSVEIPTDAVRMRPEFDSVSPGGGSFRLSPTGKRVLIEARGEIINYPAEDGEPINLSDSPGSREKNGVWSPDGRWIAFLSDRTGEEEIYLVDQKGGEWKQLTRGGLAFRMELVWSPDSKWLLFSDKFMRLNLAKAETGELTVLDKCEYDDAWERWGIQDYVWSPCSEWIAYTKMTRAMHDSIFLYSLKDRKSVQLTDDMTEDWSPSFDPEGRYLYFLSNRTFNPIMGAVDQNHIFLNMSRPYVMLLQADGENPFAPKDSEEDVEKSDGDSEEGSKEGESEDEKKSGKGDEPTRIDLDGIQRRIVAAEGVSAANLFRLEGTKKGFMYLSKPEPEFIKYQVVRDDTGGSLDLYHYDLKEREATKVLGGIANYHQSADGKKLVYRAGGTHGVVDVGKSAKVGDGKIDLGAIKIRVDRQQEFMQLFNEAWRIERDWFYDPGMHGTDWKAIGEKYRKFVPFCGNRSDLNYLIGEMISELNIGHTYVSGGDLESGGRNVSIGLLGARFEAPQGSKYHRIKHIIPNSPGDPGDRSPLDEPGCPIEVGHYLIAIDGAEVTTADNVYAFLQNKRGHVVTISYNDKPSADGAKTCRVETIGSERGIQYREWVEANRAYVDKVSGGRIGYVHIPDMGENGLKEFARYWYPQYYKKAMIVDERYNGGGFTGDMIIDRLERKLWGMTQPREGKSWRNPERVFVGPWMVLINEDTGSNGEFFAGAIKGKKLAPVLGMRTWGGTVGIEPHQDLMDGGSVTPPQFGLYSADGKEWMIEGRGVEPDIEVQNMPGDVMRGKDAQLDAAIEYLTNEIKMRGFEDPPPPTFPNKDRPRGS